MFVLPYAYCQEHGLLITQAEGVVHLLVATPWKTSALQLRALTDVLRVYGPMEVRHVSVGEYHQELEQLAQQSPSKDAASVMSAVESDIDLSKLMQEMPAVQDVMDTNDDAPIVRMLNALLTQAVRDGASDIHIEPYERTSIVRFRIDGMLRDIVQPHKGLHAAMISRLKIMADLDIAEKRLPQDGRLSVRLSQRAIDVRVSTLPCAYGERAVLRLLEKSNNIIGLNHLGLDTNMHQKMQHLIAQPHGIILVTGPTGSGKTTTLYSVLSALDAKRKNIMTVEDPIEYEMPFIGQTQVNTKIDLTFATTLRSILRQDPDIIMIGEIRDKDTAQIAVQASLTGHLVLATLHTNDAPSAITRLVDMGVDPTLLASSLNGVLAQRLVRKLCTACKGSGCSHCGHTGYHGRLGIFELMTVEPSMRSYIHDNASEGTLRNVAATFGWAPLSQDAKRWVHAGITSDEEVLRVTKD